MKPCVYVALLHAPVHNKRGDLITTSITNLDLHDISRAARTYGVKKFFIVHPLTSQQQITREMLDYWLHGYGAEYNPDRREALEVVEVVPALEDAVRVVSAAEGDKPRLVATDAGCFPNSTGYAGLRRIIKESAAPHLILFGTGWGLDSSLVRECDYILEPVRGCNGYNHLSVRSAVSIILDRLLGEDWWNRA